MSSEALDTALRVLADQRRRQVLMFLKNQVAVASENRLVEHLSNCETRPNMDDEALRDEIAISLRHNHLPKLIENDIIAENFSRSFTAAEPPVYTYAGSDAFSSLLADVVDYAPEI